MITTAFLSMWISNTATTLLVQLALATLSSFDEKFESFKNNIQISVLFDIVANIGGFQH